MRKRIQQLASGTFEYARPLLSFSTDKVDIEVLEGKDYTGDFVITSVNHVPMRGVVYTSNPRMECLTPQFEGEEVRIRFQFHSYGFVEGDIQKGEFLILCNQGEYNLSFVASVSRLYAESSAGRIRNLNDFTKLARENFEEAYRLFYSKNFKNILKSGAHKEWQFYQGLGNGAPSGQKVDEFLVAVQRKKPVDISLEQMDAEFYEISENRKEKLGIRRNQWGYIEVRISADTEFLVPGKTVLTADDFLGSVCNFEYYIKEEALHAGKNFGRICFDIPGKKLVFCVCAARGAKKEQQQTSLHREIKTGKMRLMKLYVDYRLKRIVTGAWANESIRVLDHLMAMSPEDPLLPLMKAQAYIVNRQKQEAAWIMEQFKREWTDEFSPVWGYYRYLCTLAEREPSYVDRLTDEIEGIFHRNPDNSMLFWILLFVKDEYYSSSAKRFKAIEQWVESGNYSPYFYLEAYYLIWQDPYLLSRLGIFEMRVLIWAVKHGAVTKDIALQVMNIVPERREFDPFLYRILAACYQVYPEDELLAVVCSYLIKGQRFGKAYHKWYEQGIEHELRITSLYEAYLMSLDSHQIGSVPRMIQMYFQYQSSIPYQQKAVLFVNIIAGKAVQREVYEKYKRTMEQFAMRQMEAGHINDNLAVIYEEMLGAGILNEELARKLSPILFTHKLSCPDKNTARAFIYEEQLCGPQEVTFSNGTAYFYAYSDEYSVIFEDIYGNRFADTILCQDELLMNPDAYAKKCLELAPDELPFILYHFRAKKCAGDFTETDSIYFSIILQSEKVSGGYKAKLISEIIHFYERSKPDGRLEKYLSRVDVGMLIPEERRHVIELLAGTHLFQQAYQIIQAYGYEYLEGAARVTLCSYAIAECGYEEDDFVLGLAETTFAGGKYNDVMLRYLCKYFNGATKRMAELWKAAGAFEIDTFDLEERILTQMLYTTDYIEYVEQIYDSYCAGGGREIVRMAYLSYFANEYLTQDAAVPLHVFVQLEERCLQKQELNDACRLGLLKYLAGQETLTKRQETLADELLLCYTGRNIYFGFYRNLSNHLRQKYHLYDKFFLEYHADAGARVFVHYRMGEEEYLRETLTEMYAGIFVKEFVLFFGESVQYYITEHDGTMEHVTESNCIGNRDLLEKDNQGRYAMLNEMLFHMALQDEEQLSRSMKQYYGMSKAAEAVFLLL